MHRRKTFRLESDTLSRGCDEPTGKRGSRPVALASFLPQRYSESRFTPGKDVGLVFHLGEGFRRWEVLKKAAKLSPEGVIREILKEQPNINGMRIKELGKLRGLGKNKVDAALRDGNWLRTPGFGSEILYSLPEAPVAGRNPEILTPIGEGNPGIPTAPAEVVA